MSKQSPASGSPPNVWTFTLYVCGQNQRAANAYTNLKRVCDERLNGQYRIDVVDLVENPQLAYSNNITACPTVIKESPCPKRTVIGDLSKTDAVLAKLDLPSLPIIPEFSRRAKSVSLTDQDPLSLRIKFLALPPLNS
jgi:circadian clock protein KaiB